MRWLTPCWKQIWITVIVALVLLAVYSGVGRQLIPLVSTWQPDLEDTLEALIGQPVDIASLEGDWRFLFPIVRLRDVNIGTDAVHQDSGIRIDRIELELDPGMSLYHRMPVFRRIEIDGVSASIDHKPDGWYLSSDWRVSASASEAAASEFPPSSAPQNPVAVDNSQQRPFWLRLIEQQQRMEIRNWHVTVEGAPGQFDQLHIGEMQWRHQGNSQSVTGELSWGQEALAKTRIRALLHGQLWPWKHQSGKVFLEMAPQSWERWIPDLSDSLAVKQLEAGAAVWLSVDQGDLKTLYADVSMPRLALTSEHNAVDVEHGRIQLAAKHNGNDWHLKVLPELGGVLPFDDFSISSIDLRGRRSWQVGIPQLHVGKARSFLTDHRLFPDRIHRYLANLKPDGELEQVRISILPGEENKATALDIRAHARQVTIQPYRGIPGVKPVDGEVHLSPRLGRFDFRDQATSVNLVGVYDKPWVLDRASGTVRWRIAPEASQVWLEGFRGHSAGLDLSSELTMYLPARTSARETRMRLLLGVPEASAEDKHRLLPNLLDDGVYSWIDQAIVKADLLNGALLLDGVLEEGRPDNSLTTQLGLTFKRGQLEYLQGWPVLDALHGSLQLDTPNLSVDLMSGKTLGGELQRNSGRVRLVTGKDKVTWLTVSGGLSGDSSEALRYFRETPLQDVVNHAFDHWRGTGPVTSSFWLNMPLVEEPVEPTVRLKAWLDHNALWIDDLNLAFQNLDGDIHFDSQKGLFSEQLTGRVFGGNFSASIDSVSDDTGVTIALEGGGEARWADLKRWMPLFLMDPVSGNLDYLASLNIDTRTDQLVFDVQSTLAGTQIDYPAPFNKAADDGSSPLNLRIEPGRETRITLNYDDRIRGVFAMDGDGLNRGQVYLGGNQPFLGSDAGVTILGRINEPVSAEAWWDAWLRLAPLAEAQSLESSSKTTVTPTNEAAVSVSPGGRSASDDTPGVAPNPLQSVDLTLANLTAWTLPAGETRVQATQNWGEWLFSVESSLTKGTVLIKPTDDPLDINLDYLHLPAPDDSNDVASTGNTEPVDVLGPSDALQHILAEDSLVDMMPGDLLPMTLSMDEVFVGGWNLGRWQLSSQPIENGMAISILDSDLKGLSFTGDVRWLKEEAGHGTYVDLLNVKGKELAKVQKSFRQEVIIEGEKLTTAAKLSWKGSPMAFNTESLDGLVSLKIENGTWKTEGAGALKAFGALNFKSISRRLQLDFSDLYQSGLAFDVTRAKATLKQGQLTFAEPLVVDGPGAKFLASGMTNLNDETLDMKLAVTFPVTGSLPLVAVLAGFAPQIAGAIYVTEKLIGDELEQFTSASYDVAGTWSKPDMKIRNAFDNQVDGKRVRSFKERFLSIFGLEESK